MDTNRQFPFPTESIRLTGVYYVDLVYTQKHAHTLHQHKDSVELLYIYRGEGRYRVGSRVYAVGEGDLVICNANTLHGEHAFLENTIETYCVAQSGVSIPGLPENCIVPSTHRPVVPLTRFKEMVRVMMPNIYDMFVLKEQELGRQLALTLLMLTYQEFQIQEQDSRSQIVQRTEMMVRDITSYLDVHYTEPVRMEEICQEFHISASYLSHMFKKETGISPKQYIVLRRIGEAQSLLSETNLPIGVIEEQLGFGSSCHLTSTFKKYIGISPREYRKHFRDSEA